MYTLRAGQANRIDLWDDQAPTAPDYVSIRLRFVKQGKKLQTAITVQPVSSAFAGGMMLAFVVQPKGLPPTLPDELGNIVELGHYVLYVEGTNNDIDYTLLHTTLAYITEPEPIELVVDGGPATDVFRGVIDGGTP